MKLFIGLLAGGIAAVSAAYAQSGAEAVEQRNKEIARNFYEDLWFNNNTDKYALYVADEYVVHDIGDRKNVTEPAVEQKNIADFFWKHGKLSGSIDYQIADGDLVATRWRAKMEPETFFGRYVLGKMEIPIINVFRINEQGKIVEIWNHRHDIDTGMTKRFVMQGLMIGLLIALIPAIYAFTLRRKLKRASKS